jgi:hypothetical protein
MLIPLAGVRWFYYGARRFYFWGLRLWRWVQPLPKDGLVGDLLALVSPNADGRPGSTCDLWFCIVTRDTSSGSASSGEGT